METIKMANKNGSNFLVVKNGTEWHSDIEEESEDGFDDDDKDSSSNRHNYAFLQHDIICSMKDAAAIPREWILLDSQSIIDVCLQHEKKPGTML